MKKIIIGLLIYLASCGNSGPKFNLSGSHSTARYKYAIAVSKSTFVDEKWKAVVNALKEKHNGRVFQYQNDLNEIKAEIVRYFPKYICFVVRPEEMTKPARNVWTPNPFVVKVWQFTRSLDNDPYCDAVWAILTGYDAEDALRIAKYRAPLKVKRALGTTGGGLDWVKEGITFSEGTDKQYSVKNTATKGKIEVKDDGPVDVTALFVDELNKNNVDAVWTSSHATEKDFSGFRHNKKTGKIIPKQGKLIGVDMTGKEYYINTSNPKVYLPAGNCLIGNISGPDCMALAWMRAGAYQMYGYTVPTGYGYMGWRTKNYFFQHGGQFTLAESFYIANQALLFNLEKKLVTPGSRDELGHTQNDRDTVVLYGDPAWDARLYTGNDANIPKPVWETKINQIGAPATDTNKTRFELSIKFNRDFNFNLTSVFAFTPSRIAESEIIDPDGAEIVEITDNFIMVKYKDKVAENSEKKIVFKARVISDTSDDKSVVPVPPGSGFMENTAHNNAGGCADKEPVLRIVPDEYQDLIKSALVSAGVNKSELIKAIEKCGKKYLPAMCFLIAQTPYRYFYQTMTDTFRDSEHISADILLSHIKLGYQAKETFPWAADLNADIFRKFVLSYRNTTEKLADWRTYFWRHPELRPLIDSFSARYQDAPTAREKDKIFRELIYYLNTTWLGKVIYAPRGMPDLNPMETIGAKTGRCTDLTNTLIAVLRTFGIAATGVRVVLWADTPGNHTWTAVYNPVTKEWLNVNSGQAGDLNDPAYFKSFVMTSNEKISKIYWVTPGQETGGIFTALTPRNDEVIPLNIKKYLMAKPMTDMTECYNNVVDLQWTNVPADTLIWLAVFNSGMWQPVAGARSKADGSVYFPKVGCSVRYRLMTWNRDMPAYCSPVIKILPDGSIKIAPPEPKDNMPLLEYQALLLLQSDKLKEAKEAFLAILEHKPDDPNALYNFACVLSLMDDKKDALDYLEKAIKSGWKDFEHIKKDTDLDNIRNEDRFIKMMGKLEAHPN